MNRKCSSRFVIQQPWNSLRYHLKVVQRCKTGSSQNEATHTWVFFSSRQWCNTNTPLEQGVILWTDERRKDGGEGGARVLFSWPEAETCSERGRVTSYARYENNVVRSQGHEWGYEPIAS